MQQISSSCRLSLLAVSVLAACAASDPSGRPGPTAGFAPTGAYGAYLTGRFAVSETDLDRAANQFLAALAADPGNVELTQQAFFAALLTGRPEALSLAPRLPDLLAAQLLLGDADARVGNWEAAVARFAALPIQGVAQVLKPLLVAWSQYGAGHVDAAISTLQPFIDQPNRSHGLYALHAAMILDLSGRPVEAARLYRIAQTTSNTANLRLAQIFASFAARQGQPTEAVAVIDGLREASPELVLALPALHALVAEPAVRTASDGLAEAYLAIATMLRAQDATDFSLMLLRLARDLRPDFTAARLLSADIEESARHDVAAERILSDIPTNDPMEAVVRLRRAQLAERGGRSQEAISLLNALAADFPDRPEPLAVLGDLYRNKSQYAAATAAYDRAIARIAEPSRGDWTLFYQRGVAFDRAHMWQRAEADLLRALELSPEQPFVLNYLGYSWAEQSRNLPRARQMIERAVALRPNDGSIADSLGWVLLRQGETAQAVRWLERAVELSPEDPTVNGHLGDAYSSAGRLREAQFQWRRALILHPDPDDAARLEAKLHDIPAASNPTTAEHQVR